MCPLPDTALALIRSPRSTPGMSACRCTLGRLRTRGRARSGNNLPDGSEIHPHASVFHPDRKLARAALVRRHGAAGIELDVPVVHRAGDPPAMDDALRQRPALVRATVLQRKYFIVRGAKHRDIEITAPHHTGPEF